MGSVVLDFLRKYPVMTVSVFGSILGTILTYLAPSIICQIKYGCKTIFILLAIFSLYTGLSYLPRKICGVGYSGCAYMMLAMSCVYGHHIWGYILLIFFFIVSCLSDIGTKSDKLNHISGFVFGTVAGLLLQ